MNEAEFNSTIKAIESFTKRIIEAGPEACREYLYSGLGTHNRDGTLCAEYGGERTDVDHPVHSK